MKSRWLCIWGASAWLALSACAEEERPPYADTGVLGPVGSGSSSGGGSSSQSECKAGATGSVSGISIRKKEDVEKYAGTWCVTGNVSIEYSDVVDVDELSSLRVIRGTLWITSNSALVALDGLKNVSYLGGSLSIRSNPKLPTCEAEDVVDWIGLDNIKGSVSISGNKTDSCS